MAIWTKQTLGSVTDFVGISSVMSHYRFAKGRSAVKVVSVLAVAILLIGVLAPIVFGSSTNAESEYEGTKYTVVYHKDFGNFGMTTDETYTTTVYGSIVSTEYNPQVWEYDVKWNQITEYIVGTTVVFTGWEYAVFKDGVLSNLTGETHYPGEVMTEKQIESATKDGKIHVFATWGKLTGYSKASSNISVDYGNIYSNPNFSVNFNGGNEYTNIYNLDGNTISFTNYSLQSITFNVNNSNCTIRNGSLNLNNNPIKIAQTLIIDKVTISGSVGGENHGYYKSGLYANGNVLILGSGISSPSGTGLTQKSFIQVSGGSPSNSNITASRNMDVYGVANKVDVSTCLLIHSGIYSSIVGTNAQGGDVNKSVYISLRNVTVLDTVVGGCAGGNENTGNVGGSTYIFATNLKMTGDSYEEGQMDDGNNIPSGVFLNESTILTGGSSRGGSVISSHVYISGTSAVWDVQGGGRSAKSTVTNSNVEISGKAIVHHALCGSITDGSGSDDKMTDPQESVKNVNIKVTDSTKVASVFGAGYDTFYAATVATMHNGGSIDITIEGNCVVGDVYGGGYRGSIGTPDKPIDSITITINGGRILGDVYGGGSGGVDKVCHNSNGSLNWGVSVLDTTGFSLVYARTISVVMNDGVVEGNIYGGGKSLPSLDISITDKGSSQQINQMVAYTKCEALNILIHGGRILGDVYGAGKGIDRDNLNQTPSIFVIKSDGSVWNLTWMTNYSFTPLNSDAYSSYAEVNADEINVHVSHAEITGNLYGGGAYSQTSSTKSGISITLNSASEIKGDVYGGGLGKKNTVSVTSDRTILLNGATIGGSIHGGSCYGDDGTEANNGGQNGTRLSSTILLVSGEVNGNVYGGGFFGKSYMNVTIKFGTPALKATDLIIPYQGSDGFPYLHVDSLFGGGNVDLDGNAYKEKLLYGDVVIELGSGAHGQFGGYQASKISVGRDIFGAGNYTLIDGTSSVSFENYNQTAFMASIQRVDNLVAKDTEIGLSGSADGGIQSHSNLYSLNRITNFTLEGGCIFTMENEVSRLSNYTSKINDVLATESDYGVGKTNGNKIILLHGTMLYVAGDADKPDNGKGIVRGFTELSNGHEEMYYGAFVQSSKDCDRNTAGFMVTVEGYMRPADLSVQGDYVLWYFAGHSTIDRTLSFNLNKDVVNLNVFLPKIYPTSTYVLIGLDLGADSQAMRIVQDDAYLLFSGRVCDTNGDPNQNAIDHVAQSVFFNLGIGSETAYTHTYTDSTMTWKSSTMSGATSSTVRELSTNSDGSLSLNSQLLSYKLIGKKEIGGKEYHLGSTGDVGQATVRLAEAVKVGNVYIPLNMVNLTLDFHINVSSEQSMFISTTIMLTRKEDRLYAGSSTISLPGTDTRTYTIKSVSGAPDTVTLRADTVSSGFSAWLPGKYTESLIINDSTTNREFGTATAKAATISVEYSGDYSGDTDFTIIMNDDRGNNYDIHVFIKYIKGVDINFFYSSVKVSESGTILVPLMVEFVDESIKLTWGGEAKPIEIPYGESLETAQASFIIGNTTVVCSYYEAISRMIELIPDEEVAGTPFVYQNHWVGLYLGADMLYKFNTSSPITDSMTFYAHFGVTIKFVGGGVPLNLSSVVIAPGTSLHGNGYLNIGETSLPSSSSITNPIKICEDGVTRPGYHFDIQSWCYDHGDGNFTEFSFGRPIYTNLTLVLPWIINTYTIKVDAGTSSYGPYEGCAYNSLFELTLATSYIVESASVSYDEGDVTKTFTPSGVNTATLSFTVPAANYPSVITIKMVVVQGYSVKVTFLGETDLSNSLPSGATLGVSIFGKPVSFVSAGSEYISVYSNEKNSTMTVSMSGADGTWYCAVWKDSNLLTSGTTAIGGRTSLSNSVNLSNLTPDNSEYTIAIYHQVLIFYEPSQHGEVSVSAVDVYGNPINYINSGLFKGYFVSITPKENWALKNGIQVGTGSAVVNGDTTVYSVLGTVNVNIVFVQKTVTVIIGFIVNGVDDKSKMNGLKVDLILNNTTYAGISLVADNNGVSNLEINNVPQNNLYSVQCSVDGFSTGSLQTSAVPELTITMSLLTYHIKYLNYNGNEFQTGVGVTEWNVLDNDIWANYNIEGMEVTARSSDGHQIWAWKTDGVFSGLTYNPLSTSMFPGDNRTLVLYAIPVAEHVPETTDEFVVVDFVTSFKDGIVLDSDVAEHLNGFNSTVDIDGSTLTLKVIDGRLFIESVSELGYGCIIFSDSTRSVVVISLPKAAWTEAVVLSL